jgi:4-hydroxy-tetrahydrodipicolinate synthase
MDFRGSYTVSVTPFTADGSTVDLDAQRRFIDWQLECGVPGLIVFGSTGEFLAVSGAERTALVAATVEHVNGRIPVMVGTMNAYTPNAVRYSQEAQELGADGLMIAPPYYYTPTEDEICRYYEAICDAVDLPIMLYNNPVTTNVDISAALVAKLTAELENIRYIKEASLDVGRVYDIVELTGGAMNVFAGERVVESYLLGAVGYVNPYGNYAPRASVLICELMAGGHVEQAREIERRLDAIDHTIAAGHPTYGHQCYSKALPAVAGVPMGEVRAPLTPYSSLGAEGEAVVAKVSALMDELDELADRFAAVAA